MQTINQIDQLTYDEKSVIDKSNIDSNFFYQSSFVNNEILKDFYRKSNYGFPLTLNKNDKCFKNKKNFFKINKKEFSKFIFKDGYMKYGQSNYFFKNGNIFCTNGDLKKKYLNTYNFISKHNRNLINYVKRLKSKKLKIGAFQTRNIPHFGHELIIRNLLKKVDIVFINPVIGPKKNGDFKSSALNKIYNYLGKNKYDNKILYYPIIANMHYSGPREAIHHIILRQNVGFDYFTVGRDHAGSENFYGKFEAVKLVNKIKEKFQIKIITHKGTYYCKKCKKVTFYEDCIHKKYLENISGSDFRNCINSKTIYKHADHKLQIYINKLKDNIFYK